MIGVESLEWVQIRDPKYKKVVFINILSGEYRSNLPPNTLFKPLEENQWWQLYDITSSCYYYYNTSSHQTFWKRPSNVEIIPLYRVQQFNNEATKDWKIFLNEKFENFKTNSNKTSVSRWNLLSRNRKYSFSSNNNLENIKLNSIHIGPPTGKSRLNQFKSSLSDDECLDTVPQDFCSVGDIGYSTLLTIGSRQFCNYSTRINSSPSTKSKASDGMSRSFDQMNKNEWELVGDEKSLKNLRGNNLKSNKLEVLSTPQKHQQNFPRTNPRMTMQRSSSSFRSNKDFLFSKDQQHAILNAQSMADHLHDSSATLRRATNLSKKKQVNEVDLELTKSFFASSFNFRNNVKGESVQLLSYKSDAHQHNFNQFQSVDPSQIGQPSQSSLMISSVMSASMKSCDMADEFTSIDQTSFCSAATRGTDECDGNSVFSSSSTPPPMRTSSMPAWNHKVHGTNEEHKNTLKKLQRERNVESDKNISSKRDHRPHGMCYSESDAQWEDDLPNVQYVTSEGSNLTPFAQYVIKELSLSSFNDHRKRFLGKSVPVGSLLHWTKDGMRKPIFRTSNRIVNREAPDILKRIQLYMGDRHFKRSHSSTSSSTSLVKMSAHISQVNESTSSSVLDQSILTVVVKGWMLPEMRDEIYIQLCKQTNGNPRLDSIQKGWELMCICLSFFPPTRMTNSLKQRFNETTMLLNSNHPKLRCCLKQLPRRLEQALATGAKRGVCKPTAQEFEVSRESIYTPPLFGSLLSEIMEVQKGKFPERQLPWILTTLSETVLRLNGMNMEGIFRIPGDIDEVNRLKARLSNKWAFPGEPLNFDASVPASLLKLWLRQLHEPLIPYDIYNDCLEASNNPSLAVDIVSARLPHINHLVLAYVVRFLQVFAATPVSSKTKMDANNLAMVMAPNILRSHITDPTLLLDQAKKEMSFVRLLILMWDTSFMENIV